MIDDREPLRFRDDRSGRMLELLGGVTLGTASTREPGAIRWTEMSIARGASGRYVVSRVGRSRVFHTPDAPECKSRDGHPYGRAGTFSELEDDHEPCPVCRPEEEGFLSDLVMIEVDRHSAEVCDGPSEVLAALASRDREGYEFTSRVALKALAEARERDSSLRQVVAV